MRVIIITVLLILPSVIYVNAQSANCQYKYDDSYWKIGVQQYGSKRLSTCDDGALYNCHGFIRSYFETPNISGNCPKPGWNNTVNTPYTCPNSFGNISASTWKNSGKYIQVCSETNSDVAWFEFRNGDHSAVREVIQQGSSTLIKYLSKYGVDGPLVAHNKLGSWYHLTDQETDPPEPIEYWSYVGSIQGSSNIVGTSVTSYSLISKSSVQYSWSIISGYNNAYISSGSNQSTVNIQPTHSGEIVLRATIDSNCGDQKIQDITISIQTNICLEGTYDNNTVSDINLNTANNVNAGSINVHVNCPNAVTYIWERTSGSISYWPNGKNLYFNLPSGGSVSFKVTAKNPYNQIIAFRNISFYNYGSFSIYPNPGSSDLSIDLNPSFSYDITFQKLSDQSLVEIKNYHSGDIDISNFNSGEYVVKIWHQKKLINEQQIIVNREK